MIFRLADLLDEVASQYVAIFIDTGPKDSLLTTAAFAAATHIIVPLEMQGYSSLGFEDNLDLVREVQRSWNPNIELMLLPSTEVSYFALNTNVEAFRDIRVRQAIQSLRSGAMPTRCVNTLQLLLPILSSKA